MERYVEVLRGFRNRYLLSNSSGRTFVRFYNHHSRTLADFIANHDTIRVMVRWSILPLVGMSWMALHYGLWVTMALLALLFALMGTAIVFMIQHMRFRRKV